MGDKFEGYLQARAWDEMFDRAGGIHAASVPLHRTLSALSASEIQLRADALARNYVNQGVTFDFAGEERPFPLDVVPRVIDAKQWTSIEAGVSQRVRALEAFLSDVYGQQQVVRDGVVPLNLIQSCSEFHREAFGVEPANGVRAHVSGIDLIRDDAGQFRVLEDNVRIPSGVSYVISNRRAMAQSFPELFAKLRIHPVDDYPHHLLQSLIKAAPGSGNAEPTVVVLTPGVFNSAYFEHSLLARLMGVELVEGSDLFVASNRVWMRTTEGRRRVDVIYRRVDDAFLDPVHFKADSLLGVPGLLNVARQGNVTIANAVGNGVADDKLVYTYVPDLIRYYLAEEPILPNVDTWRLEEPESLAEVLDRLDELVVKPVDGSGGKGLVVGPQASRQELDELRAKLVNDPRGWIAQPVIQLSTAPTWVDGKLAPRHIDLRPFAVNDGDDVWVLPGGLTRVALPEGQLVVNSSQGGGSKDTWVLGTGRNHARDRRAAVSSTRPSQSVPLSTNPHDAVGASLAMSQQQQQQQQQHGGEEAQ